MEADAGGVKTVEVMIDCCHCRCYSWDGLLCSACDAAAVECDKAGAVFVATVPAKSDNAVSSIYQRQRLVLQQHRQLINYKVS